MSVGSDILGVIETEVISDGMCPWSTDELVLSSFGLLGTPSQFVLCRGSEGNGLLSFIFRVLLVSALLARRYRFPRAQGLLPC